MTSSNPIMDADSTSATAPLDKRLEYETSASDQIIKPKHYEEMEPLETDDLQSSLAFQVIARFYEESKKRETLSTIYDYENPEHEIITRYYAAGSDISSPMTFFVGFSKSPVSEISWSFPISARADCGLPIEKQEITEELVVERDIRFWTPPKRIIPMQIEFRMENPEDEIE